MAYRIGIFDAEKFDCGITAERGITMKKLITITFAPEKTTANAVKFAEVMESEFAPQKIGALYVQKSALAGLKYTGGNIVAEIGVGGSIKFMPEKTTKNAVKFNEETGSEFAPVQIGTLYVQKSALAELGYTGDAIYVELKKG